MTFKFNFNFKAFVRKCRFFCYREEKIIIFKIGKKRFCFASSDFSQFSGFVFLLESLQVQRDLDGMLTVRQTNVGSALVVALRLELRLPILRSIQVLGFFLLFCTM